VVDIVEEVFRAHGRARVSMPPKVALDAARFGNPNWFHAMLSYLPDLGACGIKWAGGVIDNPVERSLPYIVSTLILTDPASAVPRAVMDGTTLTSLRTGAAAAVAVRHLAVRGRPLRLSIIGAGALGRASMAAIKEIQGLSDVRVYDRVAEAAHEFATQFAGRAGVPIEAVADAEAAASGADIIVTATTADTPLFPERAAGPGVLVVALGSYSELDPELVLRADKRIVDSTEQNLTRGQFGPLLVAGQLRRDQLHGELGAVVAGGLRGRERPDERIIAALIGMSTEDIAVASRVCDTAMRRGIGARFRFLS
jgi:ornithine cyclodeaminase/alanine dehydrogenase-like protein (mu-crystallin family)